MRKNLLLTIVGLWICLMGYAQTPAQEVALKLVVGSQEYFDSNGSPYKGVRVGEYYWMNTNISSPDNISFGNRVSKADIDLIHQRYLMFNYRNGVTDNYWDVMNAMGTNEAAALKDFHKYYGQYYALRPAVGGIFNGWMKENNVVNQSWGMPSPNDVLQLVGMCGDGTLNDIRNYLSLSKDDPSAPAFARIKNHLVSANQSYYWWFDGNNNKYGLNFVPAGNRTERGYPLFTENNGVVVSFNLVPGELAGLNQVMDIYTKPAGVLKLHDIAEYCPYPAFQSYPARYCRSLTDAELGYKLYISTGNPAVAFPAATQQYNVGGGDVYRSGEEQLLEYIKHGLVNASNIDIRKVTNITAPAPAGYVELPKGLLRGLYVQHILNGNGTKTVADVVNMAMNPTFWRYWIIKDNGKLTIKSTHAVTKEGLNGARYKVETTRGNKIYGPEEYTITSNGNIVIENLPWPERYRITEITAPSGYQTTGEILHVEANVWPDEQSYLVCTKSVEVTFEYGRPPVPTRDLKITYAGYTRDYKAVKIGEYLWINKNILNEYLWGFSAQDVTNILASGGVTPAQCPIDPATFESCYGSLLYNGSPTVSQALENGISVPGWEYAGKTAYDQLFGMCGYNEAGDVKKYLGAKAGDNEAAINIPGTKLGDWLEGNKNPYGFTLMPTGHRSLDDWSIFYNYFGEPHFRARIEVGDGSYCKNVVPDNIVGKNQYVFSEGFKHLTPARFCRRLTNEELGYKLFINNNDLQYIGGINHAYSPLREGKGNDSFKKYPWETDIKVVYNPNAVAPAGYTELPDGRFRGMYVQFVLANYEPNARQIEEVYGYYKITSPLYNVCLTETQNILSCGTFSDIDGQHWRIEKAGNDFKISASNSKLLTFNGTTLNTAPADNSDKQLWNIYIEGNGLYRIVPKAYPTKALEIIRDGIMSNLEITNYEKKSTQKWKLPHSALYLVGDATSGGWNLSQMEKIKADSIREDVFVWKGDLKTGSFKINPLKDSFNEALNAPSNGLAIYVGNTYDLVLNFGSANDNKFQAPKNDQYQITVDLNNRTMNVSYANPDPSLVNLIYSSDNLNTQYSYEGIRIGEYYWMNSNFYNPAFASPTRAQLDKYMTRNGLNPNTYPVNMDDYRRNYGEYYSRDMIENMYYYGKMYEGTNKQVTGWKLPYTADFEQLFAMCGNGSNNDVRNYLGVKAGDNPAAFVFQYMQWFNGNTNQYNFNMMPGGARLHANESGLVTGDLYDLFVMSRFVADGAQTITLKDNHARVTAKLWHWLNMRWCRKLTDQELGYKLYINVSGYQETQQFLSALPTSSVNIIKVNLDAASSVPTGYYELPNGYLRGFYVQNYFNSTGVPKMSIEEMVYTTKVLKNASLTLRNAPSTMTGIENNVYEDIHIQINGKESVIVNAPVKIDQVKIYTIAGNLVTNIHPANTRIEVSISNYPSGIYIISAKTATGTKTEKFVK